MTTTRYSAVKVNAGNDTSGNPRRGWKIHLISTGGLLMFIDENYNGEAAVRTLTDCVVLSGEYRISVKDYKQLVRDFS